jgi:hypothetical protein
MEEEHTLWTQTSLVPVYDTTLTGDQLHDLGQIISSEKAQVFWDVQSVKNNQENSCREFTLLFSTCNHKTDITLLLLYQHNKMD